jgi:hypothetical protein
LALSEICQKLENLIEEIKEPNLEILESLMKLLRTLKYWLSKCQESLNHDNINIAKALQQTLSELLQREGNKLPEDLRNEAKALVAEVESLLPALRVLQLCEALKNLLQNLDSRNTDIILKLQQNQQTLSGLLQREGNKLPEDLRNEALALVAEVESLLQA